MVGTATTFDPVAATDTASGTYITNVFDGLVTYPNGQTNAETQLATDYETSEDGRVLTFQLKEGVTYNDGQEVTAADVVYSFERVAASSNSRNTQSILDTLGVVHETETDDEGNEQYVPNSMDVEATGEYE
ncbi:ABC transporter substrate-binding protein [Halobacterium hubeiense]|uniref:ABC transporter substrate-binding protein n=1 Tax=Halobacterium hubeiense TaxID=1407499 RepID=UPI00073F1DCE|nr:ABC transporter substrate-binding protein [Halobacterium hubeiense]